MRPKLRKVNTKKRKQERKEANKKLAEQASKMMNHTTECCVCNASFKRTKETVKTWQVTIHQERVRLTCPECWARIKERVEELKNDQS